MNVKEEKICRICFNEIYKGFECVDETTKRMFNVLLLKMNWDIDKEPVICQECAEVTRKCFNFKTVCVNTENIVRSLTASRTKCKLDLRDLYENAHSPIRKDFHICRFCMDQLEMSSFIPLNTSSNELEILANFMPEMDFNMTENPVICAACRENSECYVKFAQNCTAVEEKICKYCQDKGMCDPKLSDVVPLLLKGVIYPDNGTVIPVIKKETDTFEELSIKTEEPLDIKDEKLDFVETASKTPADEFEAYLLHKDPSGMKMYKCSDCAFETKRKAFLIRHLLRHKNNSEVKMFKCDTCLFETKYKSSFRIHERTHKRVLK